MALWGTKDVVYTSDGSGSSVAIGGTTITGTGTTFTTAGISTGNIITVGVAGSCGEAIVASIESNTKLIIVNTDNLIDTGHTVTGESFEVREKPISTLGDSNYGVNEIFGVDATEQTVARDADSIYRPAHAGWVGITSYTDQHGNQRVKTEVLVAMSADSTGSGGITNDASDDTILPDS